MRLYPKYSKKKENFGKVSTHFLTIFRLKKDFSVLFRLIRKMGGKKKKRGEKGGTEKRPFFQKPKKWGISKKKEKWGDKKTAHFKKMGTRKLKKNGPTPCGRKKIQLFVFQKKKYGEKMGAK